MVPLLLFCCDLNSNHLEWGYIKLYLCCSRDVSVIICLQVDIPVSHVSSLTLGMIMSVCSSLSHGLKIASSTTGKEFDISPWNVSIIISLIDLDGHVILKMNYTKFGDPFWRSITIMSKYLQNKSYLRQLQLHLGLIRTDHDTCMLTVSLWAWYGLSTQTVLHLFFSQYIFTLQLYFPRFHVHYCSDFCTDKKAYCIFHEWWGLTGVYSSPTQLSLLLN